MESPRGVVGRTAAKAAANKWWNCVVPHEGRGFQVIANGYRISHPPPASSNLNRNSIIERVPRRIRPYLGPPGNWRTTFSFANAAAGGCPLTGLQPVR